MKGIVREAGDGCAHIDTGHIKAGADGEMGIARLLDFGERAEIGNQACKHGYIWCFK